MIRLTSDATIDIDANRKIWISGNAEIDDPTEVNLEKLAQSLTESTTAQAMAVHDRLFPKFEGAPPVGKPPIPHVKEGAEFERAALAGEAKDVDPTRTFGDDD